jgi:hypothetical protein
MVMMFLKYLLCAHRFIYDIQFYSHNSLRALDCVQFGNGDNETQGGRPFGQGHKTGKGKTKTRILILSF